MGKPAVISLIGMSGVGKTYWSKKLTEKGLAHICCDDLIEDKLAPELVKLGYSGINDVAKWMGQPYEGRYEENAAKYLECEIEVMREILEKLASGVDKDVVIDTTGSVIYTGESVYEGLKKFTTVVCLDAPQAFLDRLFKEFLRNPKPLIWGDKFNKEDRESDQEALARCYPELLNFRNKCYKRYADVTLPYETVRGESFWVEDFLDLIKLSS